MGIPLRKEAKGTAKSQKVLYNHQTFSQEAVFVPSFYISSLFPFIFFFFSPTLAAAVYLAW